MRFIYSTFFLLFITFSSSLFSQENCNNGIDDDNDGLIDLNDTDCNCNTGIISSYIPNPSFEDYSACPTNTSVPGDDQLSRSIPWKQGTNATTDYYNSCGFILPAVNSAGLNNFPHGNAIAGAVFKQNWKEYIATSLSTQLTAGTEYQLSLKIGSFALNPFGEYNVWGNDVYGPVEITIWGTSGTNNFPVNTLFSPDTIDPTWKEIGHATYSPNRSWEELSILFTPDINVNSIMIGAPKILPSTYSTSGSSDSSGYDVPYFVFDNLILNKQSEFGVNTLKTGNYCDNNLVLTAHPTITTSSGITYQWYKNGIAIFGAINQNLPIAYGDNTTGSYVVKITYGTNCVISRSFNIHSSLASPLVNAIQPTCTSSNIGTITVLNNALSYSFNDGLTWQSSPTAQLPPGQYKVKIKTESGCISYFEKVILISTLLPFPNVSVLQPQCTSGGTITITSPASEYSINGGVNWSTNPVFTNQNPGTYSVMIKNSSGCLSIPNTISLNTFFLPPPNFTTVSPICGANGSITITTPASEYSFDDGNTWSSNPTAVNLPAGIYKIKIKNSLGCTSYYRYCNLMQGYIPEPNYTSINPICNQNGSITITTIAPEYSFDNGVSWTTNPVRNNLPTGSYRIKIKTSEGCVSLDRPITLQNDLSPSPSFTHIQPTCTQGGSITITTTANEYTIDGGLTWSTNPIFNNLPGDQYYRVGTRTSPSCVSHLTPVYLYNTYESVPQVITTQPTCENGGVIHITTPAALYSFDNGLTWSTNNTATNLQPGFYQLKIKQDSGCISLAAFSVINKFYLPAPSYSIIQPTCTSEGKLIISSPAMAYSINGGTTWNTINSENAISPGYHSLVIKNSLGCTSSPVDIRVNNLPSIPSSPTITINNPMSCNMSYGTITVNTPGSEYSFDNGVTWTTNPTSSALLPGTYSVKIKHQNSCASNPTTAIINTPPDAPAPPALTITQPVSCANPYGQISILSNAFQYSFDGGLTWDINPNSGNLPAGNYSVKVRNSSYCESESVPVSLNSPSDYPNEPTFSISQPDCNNSNGIITITSPADMYSFDNGNTWTSNPISENLPAGNHMLKVKNVTSCVSQPTIAIIIAFSNFPNSPNLFSQQQFCIQQNATISNVAITGQNIKWYDAQTGGNLLSINTALQNGVTYYASQTINNCESSRIPVTITIYNTPPPTGNTTQSFCSTQNATLNNIPIVGTDVKWYSSLTNTQPLSINTPLVNNTTYYATQTLNGCESVNRLQVTITLINTLNANNFAVYFCDDLNNGHEKIDLSSYNSSLLSNTTGNTFNFYKTLLGAQNQTPSEKINNYQNYHLTVGTTKIFVRIDNTNSCHQIVELNLALYSKPIIPISEVMPICEGSSITINAGTFDNYVWSTNETSPSIIVSQPGDYSVTITENHIGINCSSTKNFKVVKSNKATIQSIITSDWTDNNNTITILITGGSVGDYEYSIDGINYQSSNTFTNLSSGEYIAYIRDKNGCGITTEEVFLLMYSKFFTPNGDGINDSWKINFSTIEPNLIINIHNRYGKLLKQLPNDYSGWDGTYLGQPLPSDDYWFTVIRANGKEYKGHFTLKR